MRLNLRKVIFLLWMAGSLQRPVAMETIGWPCERQQHNPEEPYAAPKTSMASNKQQRQDFFLNLFSMKGARQQHIEIFSVLCFLPLNTTLPNAMNYLITHIQLNSWTFTEARHKKHSVFPWWELEVNFPKSLFPISSCTLALAPSLVEMWQTLLPQLILHLHWSRLCWECRQKCWRISASMERS